ncbi:MAG: hypothetical protein NTX85_04250 [Candidatus Nomurabacteria bacterium]|nr:hypothetical protein [Candidatus Nomurabacteria bacterium]
MNTQALQDFWALYDQYLDTKDESLYPQLSKLLEQVEEKNKSKQLLRPEKGWDKILAWQVLRDQTFIFSDTFTFDLIAGEILAWTPHWDRDVFLTRNPYRETISGKILKPGFILTGEDKGEASDYEWDQTVRYHGITNEKGLYLPLYDSISVLKLCDQQIAKMKPRILNYLQTEKFINLDEISI